MEISQRDIDRLALMIRGTRKIIGSGWMFACYHSIHGGIGLSEFPPEDMDIFYHYVNLDDGLPDNFNERYAKWQLRQIL